MAKILKRTILNNRILVATAHNTKEAGEINPKPPTSSVSEQCLGCLCYTMSFCDVNNTCEGEACGPFRINWDYWADSGKPTVRNESPQIGNAYINCVSDFECSVQSVKEYMLRFQQVQIRTDFRKDCNVVILTGL